MTDVLWLVIGLVMLALIGLLVGGAAREDPRMRRRWDRRFDLESRELRNTDATGLLMCRACGASGSEKAGRCSSCGAVL